MKIILCITADDQEILVASPELGDVLAPWQEVTEQYIAPAEWVETTRAEAHGILDQLIDHHEVTNATLYSEKDESLSESVLEQADYEQAMIDKEAFDYREMTRKWYEARTNEIKRKVEEADIAARRRAVDELIAAGLPVIPEWERYRDNGE